MSKVNIQASYDEPIQCVKYVFIAIDDALNITYEINNRGHTPRPPPFSWKHCNPLNFEKYIPKHMVNKAKSNGNVVGVIQLKINQTKKHNYATVSGLGIIDSYDGKRFLALNKLVKSASKVLQTQNVEFVEAGTRIIPEKIMNRWGFKKAKSDFFQGLVVKLFGQDYYRKYF